MAEPSLWPFLKRQKIPQDPFSLPSLILGVSRYTPQPLPPQSPFSLPIRNVFPPPIENIQYLEAIFMCEADDWRKTNKTDKLTVPPCTHLKSFGPA